jgi:hypothetical protein
MDRRGFIERQHAAGSGAMVSVSARGKESLGERRRSTESISQ